MSLEVLSRLFLVVVVAFLLASCPAKAESRIRIAIVDTGVNITPIVYPYLCAGTHPDLTSKGTNNDVEGHGSMITDVVTKGLDPSKYCVQMVKWVHRGSNYPEELGKGIQMATTYNPVIINVSAGGLVGPNKGELAAIAGAVAKGITVVVSAGNNYLNLSDSCKAWPACYPIRNSFFHVVGILGQPPQYANYGGPVTDTADDRHTFNGVEWSGTSVAAAKVTNRIAKSRAYLNDRK